MLSLSQQVVARHSSDIQPYGGLIEQWFCHIAGKAEARAFSSLSNRRQDNGRSHKIPGRSWFAFPPTLRHLLGKPPQF